MRYLAILAVLFLSACSMFHKNEPEFTCPKTGILPEASGITYLAPDGQNIAVQAVLNGYGGGCSRDKDKTAIVVELTLPFVAKKGQGGAALKEKELPYFLAVLSPEEAVLQRKTFSTKVGFDNTGKGTTQEEHVLKIPLPDPLEAYKYKVVLGFVLTPEQAKYNKGKK